MDVRCNRCATEYDFDDTLISERGTTVRCTQCGFQFKVFPASAAASVPERWVARSAAGRELIFNTLSELQRAITEQRVQADDLLSRGDGAGRPLAAIPELAPFFRGPQNNRQRTLFGVAPPAAAGTPEADLAENTAEANFFASDEAAESLRHASGAPPASSAELWPVQSVLKQPEAPVAPKPFHRVDTPPGPEPRLLTPPMPPVQPIAPGERSAQLPSALVAPPPAATPLEPGVSPASRRSQPELARELVMTPAPRSSPRASSPFLNAPISSARPDLHSYDELPLDDHRDTARRARSRWIAALVLCGVLALLGATIGRQYLIETTSPTAEANATSNVRVAELVHEGNRLIEEGDLESASEPLLKASGLADKDATVLAALARLETLRADVAWLKLRLLDPAISELVQATRRELGVRVGKARRAADAAFAVAPEDMVVLRARVDALRLSGEADEAREWIKPIAMKAADPKNAYVLSALDMAEQNPSWPSIVERLQNASSAETTPGRAHVALIYALSNAGRLTEAEAELAKLDARSKGALLIDELKSFVRRQRGARPAAAAGAARVAGSAAPPPAPPSYARAPVVDFRRLLADATKALRSGDLPQSQRLFEQVLAQQPANTEALAGLGDIARRRNDPATANRMYERVLEQNPSYLPALVANEDHKWETGERSAALALYRRVLEQTGPRTDYGRRAASRIAQAEAAGERPADPSAGVDNTESEQATEVPTGDNPYEDPPATDDSNGASENQ
ncbi:MAG TPA: zinc-ribbon domain-containing protein [Polyangiaceae bacterium]|nr:zinc-ribbon domain-containing protein [Polyangiaceae bacterium]